MRIIYPVNISGSHSAFNCSIRNCNQNTGYQTNYTHILLSWVCYHYEVPRLKYIIETWTQNRDLWKFNVNAHNKVTLTIGTTFRVLDPRLVEIFITGDITFLVSKFKAVILKSPSTYFQGSIDHKIQGNTVPAFFITGENLILTDFTPIATSWSGLLCDKSRIGDWTDTDHVYWCYPMHHSISPIGFQHDVCVEDGDGNELFITAFISNRFMKLVITDNFKPNFLLQKF